MNYYEHHIGDYAAATAHLSWDEDMAYTRLLRAYYHQEKGIPEGQQYRLARASTPAQRRAVDAVIAEFFTLVDGVHQQKRAEAEIDRFKDKQRKAKASANARWSQSERNANASPDAMRTHSEGNALQTPDTRHQTTSVANATGAQAPPDPADSIFALGVPMLTAAGVSERNSRSMLGLMRKTHGDTAVVGALQRCAEEKPLQPVAWLQAALKAPVTKPDRVANSNIAVVQAFADRRASGKP